MVTNEDAKMIKRQLYDLNCCVSISDILKYDAKEIESSGKMYMRKFWNDFDIIGVINKNQFGCEIVVASFLVFNKVHSIYERVIDGKIKLTDFRSEELHEVNTDTINFLVSRFGDDTALNVYGKILTYVERYLLEN